MTTALTAAGLALGAFAFFGAAEGAVMACWQDWRVGYRRRAARAAAIAALAGLLSAVLFAAAIAQAVR